MDREKSRFVDIDGLMARVTVEQALQFYGTPVEEIHRVGAEIRMRCVFACGRTEETGDRALAIQADHPAKIWRCHHAGCGKGGNLVSLCDFLKPGENGGGRPRGERFKAILRDLQAMAAGESPPQNSPAAEPAAESAKPTRRPRNAPLAESDNERARALVNLDDKFVVAPAHMSPLAASYFRHRPYLTPEACRAWRVGYLPRDAGGDHAGGTMRGKIVYPILSEKGEVLTWFGRDPEYQGKLQEWFAKGKEGKEPEKFHFVKDFRRGLEVFGQHRFADEVFRERARAAGLFVVPGPNDAVALDARGAASVALCATEVTDGQACKLAAFAADTGAVVTVMFDCDEPGELSARVAVVELAQHCPVRLAWSPTMHGGAFRGRKADSLTGEEWERMGLDLG